MVERFFLVFLSEKGMLINFPQVSKSGGEGEVEVKVVGGVT